MHSLEHIPVSIGEGCDPRRTATVRHSLPPWQRLVAILGGRVARAAAKRRPIVLSMRWNMGALNSHRLMRFLDSLGAKDALRSVQVFMNDSLNGRVLRELSPAASYFVFGLGPQCHSVMAQWEANEVQKYPRKEPRGIPRPNPLSLRGVPAKVGFARGLDQWWGSLALPHSCSWWRLCWTPAGKSDNSLIRGTATSELGLSAYGFVDADNLRIPQAT